MDALDAIPKPFRERMDNIAITVESRPTPAIARRFGLRRSEDLLGLYEGLPNPRRGADYGNVLPDKIIIYQEPLSRLCPDAETLREEIRRTVWHEVGHYFGLSDAAMLRLERESERRPALRGAARAARHFKKSRTAKGT